MDKKEELTQIVKLVQKDIGQFELLYSQVINKVYFWCYMITGNEADALDASQEAMIRLYRKLETLNTAETFLSWLYILVRNVCYRYLQNRKRKDENIIIENNDITDQITDTIGDQRRDGLPKEAFDLKETKKIIANLIDDLPSKQKEVIILHYLEEFKVSEIAQLFNYSEGTVKSRLHSGRKNLELKINEYQEKNDVKLYSLALLPLLGIILWEHQEEICNNQDLTYKKSNFYFKPKGIQSIVSAITSTKALVIGVVIASILGVIAINELQQTSDHNLNKPLIDEELMYQKIEDHSYIEDITYPDFPTKTSLNATIQLKKDIAKDDIEILLGNKSIAFKKNKRNVQIQINENGIYTVVVKDTKTQFKIDQIQTYAPEVVGVKNYRSYLQLIIEDEQSLINYQQSYVEYEGEKYSIEDKTKVFGKFNGDITVVIYDQENHFKKYFITTNPLRE